MTRDVHPRSLLEDLCRLGLAKLSADGETVRLVRETFVPRGDASRMFGLLGSNVGDHLSAAVENVLADSSPHLEQALFADELSAESMQVVHDLVAAQWQVLTQALVPKINHLIETDRRVAGRPDQRMRVGLYNYQEVMPAAPNDSEKS